MNVGSNNLGGRVGEDGVNAGVAVCFDEWSNGGDHGGDLKQAYASTDEASVSLEVIFNLILI